MFLQAFFLDKAAPLKINQFFLFRIFYFGSENSSSMYIHHESALDNNEWGGGKNINARQSWWLSDSLLLRFLRGKIEERCKKKIRLVSAETVTSSVEGSSFEIKGPNLHLRIFKGEIEGPYEGFVNSSSFLSQRSFSRMLRTKKKKELKTKCNVLWKKAGDLSNSKYKPQDPLSTKNRSFIPPDS